MGYPDLPCSTLLYPTLPYSTLLYPTLPCSTLLYPTLPYSSLLYLIILYSTLLKIANLDCEVPREYLPHRSKLIPPPLMKLQKNEENNVDGNILTFIMTCIIMLCMPNYLYI